MARAFSPAMIGMMCVCRSSPVIVRAYSRSRSRRSSIEGNARTTCSDHRSEIGGSAVEKISVRIRLTSKSRVSGSVMMKAPCDAMALPSVAMRMSQASSTLS